MKDEDKTKEQLIIELAVLHQQVAELQKDRGTSDDPAELRCQAEERLRAKQAETDQPQTKEDTEWLLHELHVHQIELEMQNEELRNALARVEESHARYSDLYDFAPIGYLTLDESGLVLQANLTAAKQLGIERSRLIKSRFRKYICMEDTDRFHLYLKEVFKAKERLTCELRLMRRRSDHLYAGLDSVFIEDSGGNNTCRTAVTDITERKRTEEERVRLERQLQQVQKAESLGRMAGAIAHHFNNLLGVVMGNLELAAIDLPQGSNLRSNIAGAMAASGRAAAISRSMIAYLGQSIGTRTPIELADVCREALPLLILPLPKKVQFRTDLPDRGPIIRANALQIHQVLTNLVVNAGEAMGDREGDVTVAVHVMPAADIRASRFYPPDWEPKDESYACLLVSDSGDGMDPETVEKVFDPFFSTKFTGRGMGLAVVLGVVKAHDGALTVESAPGRGTVFRVFLPLSVEELRLPRKAEPVDILPPKDRGLVLLVEDEPTVRRMAEIMLERLGYEAITAADGVEALEVFRDHQDHVQCVLLDLTMPRMDGWGTLAVLRALRPDVPVILTSGYEEAKVMQGYHPEQPQAFLPKPYQMKDLEAALGAAQKASPGGSKGASQAGESLPSNSIPFRTEAE